MNVVHIINNLDVGGGAQSLVKDICNNGKYNHTVVTLEKSLLKYDDILCVNLFRQPLKSLRMILFSDVVHFHLFPSLYLAPFFFYKKKVFTEHNTFNRRRKYKVFRLIDSFFYIFYSKIICISKGTKTALEEWLIGERPKAKLEIIYNGVDFSAFDRKKNNFENLKQKFLNGNEIIIGMVGSFTKQKNQKFLIEVIEKLPKNFILKFAGEGESLNCVKRYTEDIGVKDRVEFCGLIKDIPSFYNQLDIYVHSAHWEGFGLTVVEAIASGLPVLASNVSGLKELIEPTYLFDNNDKDSLINLINNIFIKDDFINIEKSYEISKKRFDIYVMTEKYESIYKLI